MDQAQALATLGIPGLVLIVLTLVSVIIFLGRHIIKLYSIINDLQEKRIGETREVNDKVVATIDGFKESNNKLYDLFSNLSRKRGS